MLIHYKAKTSIEVKFAQTSASLETYLFKPGVGITIENVVREAKIHAKDVGYCPHSPC